MADEMLTPNSGLTERDSSGYLVSGFLAGGGRFSLLREIGRGGMGRVWLAHDERLMSPVALKFLSSAVRSNPIALTDLRLETKKSRMLSHPNIIRIYDLYEAPDEVPFISMEYVDGPSLWTLRSRQDKFFFPWEFLQPIVKQLCDALEYAHSERVVHRDLKPANMLLDDRQRLRLADFGIAAWLAEDMGNDPARHATSGTPAYMSPQQIEGKAASVTDDIYALGATLYELLSGYPPFYQNNIVYQVRNVLPTPLSDRLAELEVDNYVPPPVMAMVMACLAKDPAKRPQSARAVAECIGLRDTPAALPANVTPVLFTPPPRSASTKETTMPVTAPTVENVGENDAISFEPGNPASRRFAMLAGAAGLGLAAWLTWAYLIPKMPELAIAAPASSSNIVTGATNVASNPAPVVAPTAPSSGGTGGGSVGIEMGQVNREHGLRQLADLEGATTFAATVAEKECRGLERRPHARCFFQIDPAYKKTDPMNVRVQVEYYGARPGVLQILFDGPARQVPHYSNGGRASFNGDGGWKIANFQLNDAVFHNGQRGGADFCLVTSCPEMYIRSVTVFFDQ